MDYQKQGARLELSNIVPASEDLVRIKGKLSIKRISSMVNLT